MDCPWPWSVWPGHTCTETCRGGAMYTPSIGHAERDACTACRRAGAGGPCVSQTASSTTTVPVRSHFFLPFRHHVWYCARLPLSSPGEVKCEHHQLAGCLMRSVRRGQWHSGAAVRARVAEAGRRREGKAACGGGGVVGGVVFWPPPRTPPPQGRSFL